MRDENKESVLHGHGRGAHSSESAADSHTYVCMHACIPCLVAWLFASSEARIHRGSLVKESVRELCREDWES